MRIQRITILATIAMSAALAPMASAQDYDLVIRNGRVMDPETKLRRRAPTSASSDGLHRRGSPSPKRSPAEDSIDATGHVVAPGFIDTHTHSSDKFSIKMSMMDGVTTGLDLEAGALNIACVVRARKGKWPMNYGQCVSQEVGAHDRARRPGVRRDPVDATTCSNCGPEAIKDDKVEGWSVTVSDLEQMNRITKILDENLRQGALGVGSTIGYASSRHQHLRDVRGAARRGALRPADGGSHALPHRSTKAAAGGDSRDSPKSSPMRACWERRC